MAPTFVSLFYAILLFYRKKSTNVAANWSILIANVTVSSPCKQIRESAMTSKYRGLKSRSKKLNELMSSLIVNYMMNFQLYTIQGFFS